jgi:hypothetical protein
MILFFKNPVFYFVKADFRVSVVVLASDQK